MLEPGGTVGVGPGPAVQPEHSLEEQGEPLHPTPIGLYAGDLSPCSWVASPLSCAHNIEDLCPSAHLTAEPVSPKCHYSPIPRTRRKLTA